MNAILDLIQTYESICVFRHENPDADALGSQFGLITWIQETFPTKRVYPMGLHRGTSPEWYGEYPEVSDDIINNSLAIIVDTANADRVDDKRYTLALKRIKIDHHPFTDKYADLEWIDDHAASASEMITELIHMYSNEILSKKVSTYLYRGILADTLRFSTKAVRPKTLKMAAFLVESQIDLSSINDQLFALSLEELKFTNFLRTHANYEDQRLVYCIVTQEDLKTLNITQGKAKEKVNELGLLSQTQVWALFIEQEEQPNRYNGSLRSRALHVNEFAKQYRGGGHRLASAVKQCSLEEISNLLSQIKEALNQQA